MGTFASTQVINRRIRIRPCLGSSNYELWDKVERKLITRTVYHSYTDAFLARCAVEHGYQNRGQYVTRK